MKRFKRALAPSSGANDAGSPPGEPTPLVVDALSRLGLAAGDYDVEALEPQDQTTCYQVRFGPFVLLAVPTTEQPDSTRVDIYWMNEHPHSRRRRGRVVRHLADLAPPRMRPLAWWRPRRLARRLSPEAQRVEVAARMRILWARDQVESQRATSVEKIRAHLFDHGFPTPERIVLQSVACISGDREAVGYYVAHFGDYAIEVAAFPGCVIGLRVLVDSFVRTRDVKDFAHVQTLRQGSSRSLRRAAIRAQRLALDTHTPRASLSATSRGTQSGL